MKYTEGICGDGAAILKDGAMMTIGEVVAELNRGASLRLAARLVVDACYAADADGELDDRIDGEMLFKLAALVGEENSEAKG